MNFLMRLVLYSTTASIIPIFAEALKAANGSFLANSQLLENPLPYDFPNWSQSGDMLFPMEQCQGLTLEEATIDQMQQWMSSGKLTTQQLVTCYLQRIEQTDGYTRFMASFPLSLRPRIAHCVRNGSLILSVEPSWN